MSFKPAQTTNYSVPPLSIRFTFSIRIIFFFSFTYYYLFSLISPSVGFEGQAEYCWTIRTVPWCPITNPPSLYSFNCIEPWFSHMSPSSSSSSFCSSAYFYYTLLDAIFRRAFCSDFEVKHISRKLRLTHMLSVYTK